MIKAKTARAGLMLSLACCALPGLSLGQEPAADNEAEGAVEEVREQARRAREVRDALLREAGAEEDGIEAARAQARRRRDEEARARSAREARSAALNDLTPEEMEQKIARAEERVAGYLAGRAPGAPMPILY